MRECVVEVHHEADMQRLAAQLALICEKKASAPFIYLYGELGAGKTTFARGFLRALGVSGHVKSPTYTLVEPCETRVGCVYHFDLYRVKDPLELEYMGIKDYFLQQKIVLVEWPECGAGCLPSSDIDCYIEFFSDVAESRMIKLRAISAKGEAILQELKIHG